MNVEKKSFAVIFYIVPFFALLLAQLGSLINLAVTIKFSGFIIYLLIDLLFILSLSLVLGNSLLEAAIAFFEDRKKSDFSKILYGGKAFLPIKPIIFVVVFTACYVYLSYDPQNSGFLKSIIMLLPSAALFFNAKFFLSGRVRYISGSYICFKKKFSEMLSYYFNADGSLVFVTVEGNEIDTGILLTGDDLTAFGKECEANGLKVRN